MFCILLGGFGIAFVISIGALIGGVGFFSLNKTLNRVLGGDTTNNASNIPAAITGAAVGVTVGALLAVVAKKKGLI